MKTAWQLVKDATCNHHVENTITKTKVDNVTLINPGEIAFAFNNHYINITDKLSNTHSDGNMAAILLNNFKSDNIDPMVTTPVSEVEVKYIIQSLKSTGTSGYNGISSKILKQCASTIIKPLTYICNLSLATGTFPERCKLAIVRPIYKKGTHSEMNNYRPVSLLPTISKVLENIVLGRLSQHIDSNKILNPSQFGFQKKVCIEDAFFSLVDNILTSLDQRKSVGGIFCDLSKAFDSVNHNILLNKLQYYGVRGQNFAWFKSYLANRKQKVCITADKFDQGTLSSWEEITNGIPQGSILGPLLFNIYLNDLPFGFQHEAKPVMYADDVSVILTASNEVALKTQMSLTLDFMIKWFTANGLSLNTDKTNIKFSPSNRQYNRIHLMYHYKSLPAVDSIKFLGLEPDNHVKWKSYIRKILPKLSGACYVIRRPYPLFMWHKHTKDGLFRLFPINYGIWHHVLGGIRRKQ
jgi:hypothetical protein